MEGLATLARHAATALQVYERGAVEAQRVTLLAGLGTVRTLRGRLGTFGLSDEAAFEIEAGRARMVQPGLCEAAQLAQMDVAGGVIVAPRKHAGQHAGVGRIGIARDEREPGPCLRPHPESPEHGDVAVAAAEEDEVAGDRRGAGRRPVVACEHGAKNRTGPRARARL